MSNTFTLARPLAAALSEAVAKDETPESGGCDLSAGLYGPAASALLQQWAEEKAKLEREVAAYKWGYGYLQDRMRSLGRAGWAQDCDGEIEARIAQR